ncbi:MAG: putative AGC family protein kinase [Streblomastix strix]|uniref:non-specific serine/threonine protein kinase n=1 Tax=Streblomastix strix TaxID=222440 RepID=A0A5J4VH59_9EUKA|nr:MAG: putative AGC family protein kinase [Streblomastix strix]
MEGYHGRQRTNFSNALKATVLIANRNTPDYECNVIFFTNGDCCPCFFEQCAELERMKVWIEAIGFVDAYLQRLELLVEGHGFFFEQSELKAYLVMEYCSGGDLSKFIQKLKDKNETISENMAWDIISQSSFAVYQLHQKNIIHADIKPSNVFLTKNGKVKLADLGLARKLLNLKTYATANGITWRYLAPELLLDQKSLDYGTSLNSLLKKLKVRLSSDIWALGVSFFELLALEHPFMKHGIKFEILSNLLPVINNEPKQIPDQFPESMRKLILKMLEKNPLQRITAQQICEYPEVVYRLDKIKEEDIEEEEIKQIKQMNKIK